MVVVGVKVSTSVWGIKDPVTVTASSFLGFEAFESDVLSWANTLVLASAAAHAHASNE